MGTVTGMPATVSLRVMTSDEYADWSAAQIVSYAAEMAESGLLDPDGARARAEQQHAELLPQGLETPRMHLLRVVHDGVPVGVLWIGPSPRDATGAWVYDVEIDPAHRGRGLGRAAMLAAEQVARDAGWIGIGLNVFGPNLRARALYDSLGYSVTATSMRKPLD